MTARELFEEARQASWELHRDLFPNRRYHMDVWRARLAECKGMTAVEVAMKYGVSKSTILQWRKTIRESED